VAKSRLARDPHDRLRIASVPVIEGEPPRKNAGREAITHWEVKARGDRVALLECRLETGRTHQVRVQLSELGFPIVGDRTYARRDCIAPALLRSAVEALTHPLLHAYVLAFDHPQSGERMRFSTRPPTDFADFCALAGLPLPA
jgi:23S rRNA pseudouridine1911/1915/1917 synthase